MKKGKRKRKTQEELRFERDVKISIKIIAFVIIILIAETIAVQSKGITVTHIDSPEVQNPMDPKRATKCGEKIITAEEFCNILNEVEGKEMYYVKDNQIFQKEEFGEQNEETNECHNIPKEEKVINVEKCNFTDVQLLAEVMYAEAEEYINLPESEAEEVFKLVGSVVINRKNDNNYYKDVNTISEVIYQKGQYATRTKERIGKQEIPSTVYVWAEEILEQGAIGPANMFYEDNIEHGDYIYKQIGKLYFSCKN